MKKILLSHLYVIIFWILAAILLFASYLGEQLNNDRYLSDSKNRVQNELIKLHEQINKQLYSELQTIRGLRAVIALYPEINQTDFEIAIRTIFNKDSVLRNIALAPDMVIQHMYPVEGNEKAIGLDYRTIPAQFKTGRSCQETK